MVTSSDRRAEEQRVVSIVRRVCLERGIDQADMNTWFAAAGIGLDDPDRKDIFSPRFRACLATHGINVEAHDA